MGVQNLDVISPPDGVLNWTTERPRPVYVARWENDGAGGTTDYTVLHEWDTNISFATGNLIQDSNTTPDSTTFQDIGVPPSDLGPAGTVWYYRYTVTDNDDAGALVLAANLEITLQDPIDAKRKLSHSVNIGGGFQDGGPDDPKYLKSALYTLMNVTTDVPIPFIFSIDPILGAQGDAVTIRGQGFDNVARDWSAVARLYDSPELDGSYVSMTETDFTAGATEDVMVVTIPNGSTSGWVVIMNEAPAEQFSNTKQLGVTINEPNEDAGWYVEVYDRLNVTKKDIGLTVLDAYFKPVMNSIGTGYIDVPIDDVAIPYIFSQETKETSLLHVYLDGLFRYAFFADTMSHTYDEEGVIASVRIQGLGMEAVADRSAIGNADHPSSPSLTPTWVYGSNENFFRNPSFEDNLVILKNGGGEDGNTDAGTPEGWTGFGDLNSYEGVKDSANSRTDEWYIRVDPNAYHSGIKQSFPCEPSKQYHVWSYVKDPTAAGMRVTMSLAGADDMTATATYVNNYEYKQKWYAELDNVARNGSGDGTPGGSTDGSWQRMDIEIKSGKEQTSIEISIQADHHTSASINVPFWIDDVEIEGFGLGMNPWVAFDADQHATSSFVLSRTLGYGGSETSCKINGIFRYAGIEQTVTLNPSTKYTATIHGLTYSQNAGDVWSFAARDADDDTLYGDLRDEAPGANGLWKAFEFVFETPENGGEPIEIDMRFVYTGTDNPPPFYIDGATLVPGEPPSKAGVILDAILAKIQARGELTYLQTSYTAEKDSRGYDWPAPLSLDIAPTETLYGFLQRLVALGHEWSIVPVNFEEGGNTDFMLNVYTARALNSNTGLGLNYAIDSPEEAPVIMPSDATIGGRVVKQVNMPNTVIVSSPDGVWTQAYQEDFGDYVAGFGSISEYITAGSGIDSTTLSKFAEARLAELKAQEAAVQLNMQRSSNMRPWLHFGIGTSILVDIEPYFTPTDYQRVRSIATTLSGEGTDVTFVIDLSKVLYEDEMSLYAKIAQLSERAPADIQGQGAGRASSSGSVVTVTKSTSTSSTSTGVHEHELDSNEVTNKATSGDVSGSLPGPLSVIGIKGIPVDSEVPVGVSDLVLVYDRDAKAFVITDVGDLVKYRTTFLLGGM